MLACMEPELQKQHIEMEAYTMISHLKEMFQEAARIERFSTVRSLLTCKMTPGSSVGPHVLKIKGYLDQLDRLGHKIQQDLAIDIILHSLSEAYDSFVMNFNMHSMEKTVSELHGMLITAEKNIKGKTKDVLMVNKGKGMKRVANAKDKGKGKTAKGLQKPKANPKPKSKVEPKAKEGVCYFCNEAGHWKRNCKLYLDDLKKNKGGTTTSGINVIELNLSTSDSDSWVLDTGSGTHICTNVQGLRRSRELAKGEVYLRVGNGAKVAALAVGTYDLSLSSGLVLSLESCYYVPTMRRNIISISCLDKKGFQFIIQNNKCSFYLDNIFYGCAPSVNGLYVLNDEDINEKPVYNIVTKKFKSNDLNSTYLWHCRLGHINEKRISKLHQDGLLDSFDYESFDTCESCLLGKITKTPFTGKGEKASDLLGLIIQMCVDR